MRSLYLLSWCPFLRELESLIMTLFFCDKSFRTSLLKLLFIQQIYNQQIYFTQKYLQFFLLRFTRERLFRKFKILIQSQILYQPRNVYIVFYIQILSHVLFPPYLLQKSANDASKMIKRERRKERQQGEAVTVARCQAKLANLMIHI